MFSVSLHGEALRTELRVTNTGDKPFDFTAALHSYFEVLDVEKAAVKGLKGLVSHAVGRQAAGCRGAW